MTQNEVVELIKSDAKKDLHIHSVFSDGVLTPEEIVDRWEREGNSVIAITDHDGIGGSEVAVKYAEDRKIRVIPGIEFDSENELGKDLHILGYGIDFSNTLLCEQLDRILRWREARNELILDALRIKGIEITEEEIYAVNEGRFVGKPTFARILVNRGEYNSMEQVFSEFFSKDTLMKSIKKKALRSKDVVDTIHAAGGIVVLAHPMEQIEKTETFEEFEPRLVRILDTFVDYGIDGIECYHPSANESDSEYLRAYAEDHGLLVTRGSDFHFDGMKRDYSRG